MSKRHASPPDLIQRQAVEWMLRLDEGDLTEQDKALYDAWQRANPRHAEAMSKLRQAAKYFDVPRQMGIETATLLQTLEKSSSRRRVLRHMTVFAGVAAGAGWLAQRNGGVSHRSNDFQTAVGERRSYRLPDQSLITLNALSAADIAFDRGERRIHLRSGMLMASVAHDGQRPFVVDTQHGRIRALGTQFQTRLLPHGTEVAVVQSKVEIHTGSGAVCQVHADEQAMFTARSIEAPRKMRVGATAWVDGYYVALDEPLATVIDALRPYRRGVIRLDPAIASLRVSAALPLDHTDQALHSLASIMPIEIQRYTAYLTVVSAR